MKPLHISSSTSNSQSHQAIALTARNIPFLSGRILIQTSLRHVSSSSATIAHARTLARLYDEAGVPRNRFAIKIPFSGPAAAAARVLNEEGIRTLATSVFSLEQAVAASQSGCLFISPYYNGMVGVGALMLVIQKLTKN